MKNNPFVGEFASDDDPPVGVEIVGTLLTDDGVDAKGARSLGVLRWSFHRIGGALLVPSPDRGTDECPADTDHIIKTKGVSGPGGAD